MCFAFLVRRPILCARAYIPTPPPFLGGEAPNGTMLMTANDVNEYPPPFGQVNMLMNTGQGLAIEKSLSKFDVKVLAAETRKQVLLIVYTHSLRS